MDDNRFEAAAREAGLLDPRCIRCDYNLRDNTAGRCPECGQPFEAALLVPLAIPWLYRRQISYVRAYRQTLWFMVRRSAKLKHWTNYPLDAGDAWAFARWTQWVLLAMAAAVAGTLLLLCYQEWPRLWVRDPGVRAHLLPLWKDPALYTAIWWWLQPVILLAITWLVLGVYLPLCALTTSRSDPNRERNAVLGTYVCCTVTVLMAIALLVCVWAMIILDSCGISGIWAALLGPVLIAAILLMGIERTGRAVKELRDPRSITEGIYMGLALVALGGITVLLATVTFLVGDVIESLLW